MRNKNNPDVSDRDVAELQKTVKEQEKAIKQLQQTISKLTSIQQQMARQLNITKAEQLDMHNQLQQIMRLLRRS